MSKYLDRIANGLCGLCGVPTNGKRCEKCVIQSNLNRVRLREERGKEGLCKDCSSPVVPNKAYCEKHLERKRKDVAKHTSKLKDLAYQAYGGYVCSCCGETEVSFLTLDHINNDGATHRRAIGFKRGQHSSAVFYRWLKANNYPPGIQVLCANCQLGKVRNGGVCPHKFHQTSHKDGNQQSLLTHNGFCIT